MRLGHLPAAGLAVLALAAALPAGALADGDPASDILPANDTYLPYSPKVDAAEAKKLESLVAAAKAKKIPFKVAVIATKDDLGAITELYGMSPQYAKFLYSEIRTFVDGDDGTLLVAMPGGGIGIAGKLATPAGRAAAAKVPVASNATATQVAAAAVTAMNAVAKANGRTLPSGGSGGSDATTIIVIVVLVLAFGAGIALILRGRRPPPAPAGDAA